MPQKTPFFETDLDEGEFVGSPEVPEICTVHEMHAVIATVVLDELGHFCRTFRTKLSHGVELDKALADTYLEFEARNSDDFLTPTWKA